MRRTANVKCVATAKVITTQKRAAQNLESDFDSGTEANSNSRINSRFQSLIDKIRSSRGRITVQKPDFRTEARNI